MKSPIEQTPTSVQALAKASPQRPGWKKWLVALARRLFTKGVHRMHYNLFRWHCETFFPLRDHMTDEEWAYIDACIRLEELFPEIPHDSGYDGYSYFSYSHRVDGDKINSSRVAFGSLGQPGQALEAARPIFEQRKIELDPYFLNDPNSLFYGLGWDFLAGHFKVYFRILELSALPQASLQALMETTIPLENRRREGLISFTFVDGELYEEKVYVYPKAEAKPLEDIFPGTKGRVLMATSRRGTLTQYDVSSAKIWKARISKPGQEIMEAYSRYGYPLDTIALTDPSHYTLYFPGIFNPFKLRSMSP